jgi:ribosomal protein S18 acetylase RimI-like enzyme
MFAIEPAVVQDAEAILALQRLAYQSEASIYDDYRIPPLTQTLDDLRAEFQDHVVLKAVAAGKIVGSVRAHLDGGAWEIGRLIVHPEYQNRGLGSRLMAAIEQARPAGARCALFTGHKSARNLYLYGKLGYREVRREAVSPNLVMVYLEK